MNSHSLQNPSAVETSVSTELDPTSWGVVTDIDGTLVTSETSPNSEEVRRFRQLTRTFAFLGYATGRIYDDARALIDRTGLPPPDFWVCELGTDVRRRDGRLISCPEPRNVSELHARSLRWPLDGLIYQQFRYERRIRLDVETRPILDELHARLGGLGECCVLTAPNVSGGFTLDILPMGAGKAAGVTSAKAVLGLNRRHIYFGDAHNDLTALLAANLGCLMPDAPEDVRLEAVHAILAPARGLSGVNRVLQRWA